MTPREFFAYYREDRRSNELPGFEIERFPHLTCYTPYDHSRDGLVTFAELAQGHAERQIYAQIDYFALVGIAFEWKVYEFDQPKDLAQRLEGHGFRSGETEALLHLDLDALAAGKAAAPAGVTIRRITNAQGIKDIVAVQTQVWNRDCAWLQKQMETEFTAAPQSFSMYCAYDANGTPIGTGSTRFGIGSRFPELISGAVLDTWRGRGLFRALTECRLEEARSRKFESVTADASASTYPILLKMGFEMVCHHKPMIKRAPFKSV